MLHLINKVLSICSVLFVTKLLGNTLCGMKVIQQLVSHQKNLFEIIRLYYFGTLKKGYTQCRINPLEEVSICVHYTTFRQYYITYLLITATHNFHTFPYLQIQKRCENVLQIRLTVSKGTVTVHSHFTLKYMKIPHFTHFIVHAMTTYSILLILSSENLLPRCIGVLFLPDEMDKVNFEIISERLYYKHTSHKSIRQNNFNSHFFGTYYFPSKLKP